MIPIVVERVLGNMSTLLNAKRDYFAPVFKLDCQSRPYPAGTVFAIQHNGISRLITAAHVLDKDHDNACDSQNELFLFVNGALRQLKSFHKVQIKQNNVPIDVVAIAPNDFDVREAIPRIFGKDDVHRAPLTPDHYVAACGFPETKNRTGDKSATILKRRPFAYLGRASASSKCRRAGFDVNSHFCFDMLLKKTFVGKLREIKAPKPHGISGGPVLIAHDLRHPARTVNPRLRGVVIESAPKMQCIVCVDIAPIFDALLA